METFKDRKMKNHRSLILSILSSQDPGFEIESQNFEGAMIKCPDGILQHIYLGFFSDGDIESSVRQILRSFYRRQEERGLGEPAPEILSEEASQAVKSQIEIMSLEKELLLALYNHCYQLSVIECNPSKKQRYAAWSKFFNKMAFNPGDAISPCALPEHFADYVNQVRARMISIQKKERAYFEALDRVAHSSSARMIHLDGSPVNERCLLVHPVKENYKVAGCFEYFRFHDKGGRHRGRKLFFAARDRRDPNTSGWVEISAEVYYDVDGVFPLADIPDSYSDIAFP